tara:strand:- start:350 stop:610 length:261 start_codon:yes stop_codon:yes gene_type:complete
MDIQEQFYDYIEKNDINNVKLLLNDKRVDPSDRNNWAIRFAFKNKHFDIVNLLWQDQRIKNSLKNHDEELYNQLVKQDTKEKVDKF